MWDIWYLINEFFVTSKCQLATLNRAFLYCFIFLLLFFFEEKEYTLKSVFYFIFKKHPKLYPTFKTVGTETN